VVPSGFKSFPSRYEEYETDDLCVCRKVISSRCRAVVGIVAGGGRIDKPFLKAGRKYHAMRAKRNSWPKTRGVAMNVSYAFLYASHIAHVFHYSPSTIPMVVVTINVSCFATLCLKRMLISPIDIGHASTMARDAPAGQKAGLIVSTTRSRAHLALADQDVGCQENWSATWYRGKGYRRLSGLRVLRGLCTFFEGREMLRCLLALVLFLVSAYTADQAYQ
jgi:hypothetical protein